MASLFGEEPDEADHTQQTQDPNQDRINELTRLDNSLPLSIIHAFISPQHNCPYTAIQEIMAVGDFSDQSHLLFDENFRATAKKEYDAMSRSNFNIDETDRPEWDSVIRNAEKRARKKKQRAEEQQSVQQQVDVEPQYQPVQHPAQMPPTPVMQEMDHGQGVQSNQSGANQAPVHDAEYYRLLELEMEDSYARDA